MCRARPYEFMRLVGKFSNTRDTLDPPEDLGKPTKTPGVEPRSTPRSVFEPTRALGDLMNLYTAKALIQVPLKLGQGFSSFCGFARFCVVFLGLPAGFPTLPALF